MKISIDVNGVLRDTLGKIEQVYVKWYVEPYDLLENKENAFEYKIIHPINSIDLTNHFMFPNPKDDLYDFLYNEYPMEIFGHAPSVEYSSMNDLNDFYYDFRDDNQIRIISDEIGKSKPATLFFLSKFSCMIESVQFYNNQTIMEMWGGLDVLLTANPNLILNKPENKLVIKYNTYYNNNLISGFSIDNLKELSNIIKKI